MPVNFNVSRARKLLPLVLFLLTGTGALAQTSPPSTYVPQLVTFNGVPFGPCDVYQVALNVSNGVFYTCAPLTRVWVLAASGLISTTNNWTGLNTFSQPITSTASTGTAPFSIASTTVVPNLNAQLHGGLTAPASAIVGINDTQTLTAKTLTSPTVTNPTITGGGSWAGSPTLTSPTINTPTITSPTITGGGSWAGSPSLTTPTIDGVPAAHAAQQVSAATNYGTALGSQTIIASLPSTGNVSVLFQLVQVTAGVGCSAATNSVTVNGMTWTAPGGTVETANPSSNMGFTGNGAVDSGAATFGTSAFTNNGIQAVTAKSGTSLSYTTTSTLASTGCTTTPQYQIYAKAIF